MYLERLDLSGRCPPQQKKLKYLEVVSQRGFSTFPRGWYGEGAILELDNNGQQ